MTALTGVPFRGRFATLAGGIAFNAPDPVGLDPVEAAALAAALEEIPSAAFVVWADGRIALGNRPGEAAHVRTPAFVASGLLASIRGLGNAFRVTPILAPGAPAHFLAVQVGGIRRSRSSPRRRRREPAPHAPASTGPRVAGAGTHEQGDLERARLRRVHRGDPRHGPAREVGMRGAHRGRGALLVGTDRFRTSGEAGRSPPQCSRHGVDRQRAGDGPRRQPRSFALARSSQRWACS